jgi:hypothetical protein
VTRKRILLVGGAGVFGSRLARGLVDTVDADVLIAGRNLAKAQAIAREVKAAGAVALDRNTATPADIRALSVDLVIDAAGPFQGADLSFARACIAAGVDYLDLADGRDFVAAFPALDAEAKAAGVRAITGASSTPAITHAALDELTRGWTRIDTIRAGISPGNRAPRGRSVVEAILSWAGAPLRVFEGGAWRERPGWSGTRKRRIAGLGVRRFALAETPDLDLLVARFSPREDAVFTAGLELGILHRGLAALGWLKAAGIAQTYAPVAGMLQWLASLFHPFGSDRGGMYVEALGRDADGAPARAEWTLVSPPVVGPFTPTLPALALTRKLLAGDVIATGARACVDIISLSDLAGDFARIGLSTALTRETMKGPFELALGESFEQLPPAVKAAHRQGPVSRFEGRAHVAGANAFTWLPARLFGFPRKAEAAPVRVTKTLLAPGREIWEREIGDARFRSEIVHAGPGHVTEKFGPFTFTLALEATRERLVMSIVGWRMGWLPLPAFLAPRSVASEASSANGAFTFDVPIAAPLLGRLTHYKGELQLQGQDGRTT